MLILWTYEVKDEFAEDFVQAYGPAGDWARLFQRAEGFVGVQLLREGRTYLTIDEWRSAGDFEAFLSEHRADYEALDLQTQGWTLAEHRVGQFHPVR